MDHLNHIKVVIDENVYELTSHESEEYVQSIARYIDKKIKEIYLNKTKTYVNSRLQALFLSINIADDLFKEREKNKNLNITFQDINNKFILKEKENKELLKEIGILKSELSSIKQELKEYIELFEAN